MSQKIHQTQKVTELPERREEENSHQSGPQALLSGSVEIIHESQGQISLVQDPAEMIVMQPNLFTKYGRRGKPHKVYVQLCERQKEVLWWDEKGQTIKDARRI